MKSLLLVKGSHGRLNAVAAEAMQVAFPETEEAVVGTLEAAVMMPEVSGVVLFVILDGDAESAAAAAEVLDTQRLPRWAVVVCSPAGSIANCELVAPDQWNKDVVSHVLALAWSKHLLRRENARFRGDLMSIATRVVHDLRTPLGGILSGIELLSEYLALKAPSEASKVQRIIESEEEMLKVIKKLAMFSHELSGPLVMNRFNVGDCVALVLDILQREVVRVKDVVIQPSLWPEILADQRKIERIFRLLIENALTHAGSSRTLELGWKHESAEFKFWVNDDGPGVSLSNRGLLFYPFHRLHESNAARGLGLPVVDRLVQMQGGRCGYEPRVGGGSCFYFILPG